MMISRFLLARVSASIFLLAMLAACGESEEESAGPPGPPAPPAPPAPSAPAVSFVATPDSVDPGGFSTLTWDATAADNCTASGAWDGDRSLSGSEDVGPLSDLSEFMIECVGTGGRTTESVVVSVNGVANPPTLVFTASPTTIASGLSAMLSWSATNADTCMASGGWTGPKSTMGNESTGSLSDDRSFTLRCTGPGGNVTETVSVTVTPVSTGANIQGQVDSSLANREGDNRIYAFAGTVSPDDYDGDSGDPIMTAAVLQDAGGCTWSYAVGNLSAGDYTIAFTSEAADDDLQRDDSIGFFGTTNVTVSANTEFVDFDAANIIRVGPGRALQTVAAAASAAQDGDVVEIDAGLYPADVAVWYQDNLTLRGVGGYAHLRADGANVQGKSIWVIAGNDTVVENIEFSEVTVPDQNGAGIRHDGFNLVVCNGYFHDSEEGILGGAGDVLVEYSEFANNGYGDGFSHNMYILDAERFTLRYSYTHHARIGHNVKSRARENYILYNRIMDESSGTASYAVDIPNGGLSYVIGNLMQQGPGTDNYAIVNYGTEGLSGGRTHNLYIVNNTIVDDRGGGVFIQTASGTSVVRLINNLFVGDGTILTGASGDMTTNLRTTSPGLVDIDTYDYRLTSGSSARDAGSAPGMGNGIGLAPVYQYLHMGNRELRPTNGAIDIGAYEYVP